jgi:hypothetical protein
MQIQFDALSPGLTTHLIGLKVLQSALKNFASISHF